MVAGCGLDSSAKMEKVSKKLDFRNISFQLRTVARIVESLPNNIESRESPEMTLLWENCSSESSAVSSMCCQALINMIIQGKLEASSVIDEFISLIPSAKHHGVIVEAVGRILINQASKQTTNDNHNYLVSFSAHPLIKILRESSETTPFVFQWIQCNLRNCSFNLMKPLVSYVLLDTSFCNSSYKDSIYSELLEMGNDSLHFMLRYLPFMQINDVNELLDAINIVEKVGLCYFSNGSSDKTGKEMLLLIALCLCKSAANHNLNVSKLLSLCKIIIVNNNNVSNFTVNVCITILSVLITDVVGSNLYQLLCFGEALFKLKDISPFVVQLMIVPLLSILSGPYDDLFHQNITEKATLLFTIVEKCSLVEKPDVSISWKEDFDMHILTSGFHSLISQAMHCVQLMNLVYIKNESNFIEVWLDRIILISESSKVIPCLLVNTVSGVLTASQDLPIIKKCLQILQTIVIIQPEYSLSLLPLLLHKLNIERDPVTYSTVLDFLPLLATHSYSTGAVLNALQLLMSSSKLKPQGIRLMLLLWKQQRRCFPYLEKLLEEGFIDNADVLNEVLLSQAAAMKEICTISPQNYGTSTLKYMSNIFNKCSSEINSPAVALALNGIFNLCKAEEIDIRTVWKALARKLANDKRPLVMKYLFKLFSLVPELQVSSPAYDKFMTTVVEMLWKHVTVHNNPYTVPAAYEALGKFPPEYHHLKLLPKIAKAKIILPVATSPLDLSKDIDDIFAYTPGYCFIHLLESIEDSRILKGYEEFLTGLIKYEVDRMPRSVYHTARLAVKPMKHDKIFSDIPQFLCMRYSSNRQPAMQSNLAFSVLMSYHPPVELGRNGLPTKQSLILQSNYYHQILEAFLQDISIDTSDWWHCVLLSFAWTSFIDRAFVSCIEGANAEQESDSNKTEREASGISSSVRDSLLEIIKTHSKEKPANAILAVVGLAVSVWKYENSSLENEQLNLDNSCIEFIGKTLETAICVLDPSRKPRKEVFGWLLTHGKRSGFGSSLFRGYAAISLCHLVPFIMGSSSDMIEVICNFLLSQLSSKVNHILQLYCGVGIGLFIQALCHEGQVDDNILIMNTTNRLEYVCMDENEELLPASLIGLTLSTISLCQSNDFNKQDYIKHVCAFCVSILHKTDPTSICFDVLCQCTVLIIVAGYIVDLVTTEECEELLEWFKLGQTDRPQCIGTAVALGAFVGILHKTGNSVSDYFTVIFKNWLSVVLNEGKPLLHRLSALRGLASLYTTFSYIFPSSVENKSSSTELAEVIQVLMKLFKSSRDVTLQGSASLLLGEIYSTHGGSVVASSQPTSYFYLDEKYVLKGLLDFITKTGKNDPTVREHLNVCLNVLSKDYSKPLPPISWTTVFTPFLHDDEMAYKCLKILISQSSSATPSLLTALVTPPRVFSLSATCHQLLINSLPNLLKCLPITKLNSFLSSIVITAFSTPEMLGKNGEIVLNSILNSLNQSDLSPVSKEVLQKLLMNIVNNYFVEQYGQFEQLKLTRILCDCLSHFPSLILEGICNGKNLDVIPTTILCCNLMRKEKLHFSSLSICIDLALELDEIIQKNVIKQLLEFFIGHFRDIDNNSTKLKNASDWLIETMSQINSKLKLEIFSYDGVDFLLDIFSCAIIGFSGIEVIFLIEGNDQLLIYLPTTLPILLAKECWNHLTVKIIEWILFLVSSKAVRNSTKTYLLPALCSLRSFKEFAKFSIYSQIYNFLDA